MKPTDRWDRFVEELVNRARPLTREDIEAASEKFGIKQSLIDETSDVIQGKVTRTPRYR